LWVLRLSPPLALTHRHHCLRLMASDFSILCNRTACRLLSADQRCDTIKVDPRRFDKDRILQFYQESENGVATIGYEDDACKENVQPPPPLDMPLEVATFQAALKERQQQEETRRRALQWRQDQEDRRQSALQEARAQRDEERRLESERLEMECREAEHLAEERRRSILEEQARFDQEAKEAKEAMRLENDSREKEQKAMQDERALRIFLSRKGYSGVNMKRTKMFKSKYPLHTAVKENSLELVKLLLAAKADPSLKSSTGLTPAHLAMKLSNGSHDDIICSLQRTRSS